MTGLGTLSSSLGGLIAIEASASVPRTQGFIVSDIVFGFESGHIEHRTMDGELISTFVTTDNAPVRGLRFDRDGNLYAVLPTMIEKFRQPDTHSVGRWDTALTWDASHIPWDIVMDYDETFYVLWGNGVGDNHGWFNVSHDGTTLLATVDDLTASASYDGRQLKIDIDNMDLVADDGFGASYVYWTDGYYTAYYRRVDLTSDNTQGTHDPDLPWQTAGFRLDQDNTRQMYFCETQVGAPAGPRNAMCLCADGNTLWADEINTELDIEEPNIQHADRYKLINNGLSTGGEHVRRVTTSVNHPILSMDSYNFVNTVKAVCGDIFLAYIDPITSGSVIGVFSGTTGAKIGKLRNPNFSSYGYSSCFDSNNNFFMAVFIDNDDFPDRKASVIKYTPTSDVYSTYTRFWTAPTTWTNAAPTPYDRVCNVSVDSSDNVYIGWYHIGTPGDSLHLTKVQPDGTEVWTRDLPIPSGSAAIRLTGGQVTLDGTTYYYLMNYSGHNVIAAYDVVGDAALPDFYNETFAFEDFNFFPFHGVKYSNGVLVSNNEGYEPTDPVSGIGIARKWTVTGGSHVDYTPAPPLSSDNAYYGWDIALDFVTNSFVVAEERDYDAESHLGITRFNVITGAKTLLVDRLRDTFINTMPIAVLCPGSLSTSRMPIMVTLVGAT